MSQKKAKKKTYLKFVGRRFATMAGAVHFTAEGEREQASSYIDTRGSVVIPLLMDFSHYHDLPGQGAAIARWPELSDGIPNILFLSRLHPKKGLHVLVDAVAELRSNGCHVRLVIAGPDDPSVPEYRGAIERQLRDLKIDAHVTWTGLVTGREKVSLYQACDVFVLPTESENFGFVQIEAMAAGRPIIITKGSDIWLDLAQAGAVIAEMNATDLAAKIRSLIERPEEVRRLGASGRHYVLERFAPETVISEFESMIGALQE